MSDERKEQIRTALAAMGGWTPVAEELGRLRAKLLDRLIQKNDEETRGKVKALDVLIRLPKTLQEELSALSRPKRDADGNGDGTTEGESNPLLD